PVARIDQVLARSATVDHIPVKRIDYVAVAKGAAGVRGAWVPENVAPEHASDHRAVVADLVLRGR
ncbi:hypothetical protein I3W98_28370, partial [Streptomyces cavourensis]|nr:hypothetical protein [Streptomyces cavourensis]